jgi:hypothetical protein
VLVLVFVLDVEPVLVLVYVVAGPSRAGLSRADLLSVDNC